MRRIEGEKMVSKSIVKELQRVVGKANVLTSPEDLICYSYDGTFAEHQPDVVVQPVSYTHLTLPTKA